MGGSTCLSRRCMQAWRLIVMIECVMAGRVVPMFTKSVTPGLVITVPRRLELGTLAVTALALALWVFTPGGSGPVGCSGRSGACRAHAELASDGDAQTTHSLDSARVVRLDSVGLALLALAQLGWVLYRCGACPRCRCHRRVDHRHDHPHGARAHRSTAAGHVLKCWPMSW